MLIGGSASVKDGGGSAPAQSAGSRRAAALSRVWAPDPTHARRRPLAWLPHPPRVTCDGRTELGGPARSAADGVGFRLPVTQRVSRRWRGTRLRVNTRPARRCLARGRTSICRLAWPASRSNCSRPPVAKGSRSSSCTPAVGAASRRVWSAPCTGVVPRDEIVKGYEYAKDDYVAVHA